MKHPTEAALALHAGGDLGAIARWRVDRHLRRCDACREQVAQFEELREELPELAEIPEIPWNRLAAEMKANIRLGLAAGECVRSAPATLRDHPLFTGTRAWVALASVIAVVGAGLMLERPAPSAAENQAVLQTIRNGIQYRQGDQALRLMNTADPASATYYSVGAEGSVRARFVDADGYVMINNVHAD